MSGDGPGYAEPNSSAGWLGSVRVTVVLPAINEAENLDRVLPRIPTWVHEVILVDGGSLDRTVEVARHLLPHIKVVCQIGRGKGDALRQGFAVACGDVIVMLDADGSTDPREIPFFVGALLAGADFAKGTRYAQGGGSADLGWLRSLGNRSLTVMCRLLFGSRCTDLCYGYNAFWSKTIRLLDLDASGFDVEAQMNVRALRAGLRVVEVPSYESQRCFGASNLRTWTDGWRVLTRLLREWRARMPAPAPVDVCP